MKINAVGCALIDHLFSPIDFNSPGYRKWEATSGVENGIITGGLIFGDDLERTSETPYAAILAEITGQTCLPSTNIGGPAVVALIHMSQVLDVQDYQLGFYGAHGDDEDGKQIVRLLQDCSIDTSGYQTLNAKTPFTDVFIDPSYNDNNGERTFINYMGAAGEMTEQDLPAHFFNADMLIFGGTALTPGIHDNLSALLKKARRHHCITCINTVYDFRNQKRAPEHPWPLVQDPKDFELIDLLLADNEEAIRISGQASKSQAAKFFLAQGVKSGIITHGGEDFVCFSNGALFEENSIFSMPVSEKAGAAMRTANNGNSDTTGCGDNFAGGVYASVAEQSQQEQPLSLKAAAACGAVAGGFAGLYCGGVFKENHQGEKAERLHPLHQAYAEQV